MGLGGETRYLQTKKPGVLGIMGGAIGADFARTDCATLPRGLTGIATPRLSGGVGRTALVVSGSINGVCVVLTGTLTLALSGRKGTAALGAG